MKKYIIVSVLFLTIAGVGLLSTSAVYAETNGQESLVQMIADKFHLNKSDVQGVFDQHRTSRLATMQTRLSDRLTQDVKDGKITDAQKTLIENKLKELAANRSSEKDSFKNLTPDQRKTKMQAERQSLADWAKQHNIPTHYLIGGFGRGIGFMGHRMGKW